ncbi:MAG TPA: hypothetical protein VN520_10665 [Streptomyces sp.]|uniref:hypothetical protein n=1 Tax=Streptomyces sp. TaxID=1931 RepID=UPI002B9699FA|nr:hypothetical protein [Streptomyces sp.]HWU06827.1 hypothetical protein [Streptomyces sp.]
MTENAARRPAVPSPRSGGAGDFHAGTLCAETAPRFAAAAVAIDAGGMGSPPPGSAMVGGSPPRRPLAHRRSCTGRSPDVLVGTVRPQGRNLALTDGVRRHTHEYGETGRHPGRPGSRPHVRGAGPGVRADVRLRCGGCPAPESGEGHAPVFPLEAAGRRVLRTGRFPVLTSARLTARARGGHGTHPNTLAGPVRQLDRCAAGAAEAMTANGAGGSRYS